MDIKLNPPSCHLYESVLNKLWQQQTQQMFPQTKTNIQKQNQIAHEIHLDVTNDGIIGIFSRNEMSGKNISR